MAAIGGLWASKNIPQSSAPIGTYATYKQQGTGWNPIHAQRGGPGRNIAPDGTVTLLDSTLTEEYQPDGYTQEDGSNVLWGYGTQTGTSDRPPLGDNAADAEHRISTKDFPTWGPRKGGILGGARIRSINRGGKANVTAKLSPTDENPTQGWLNKEQSYVEDATVSDPSQYVMQTSMTQRDQTRAGSQAASGRENQYDAPIKSRIPGMRAKFWGGEMRHGEMLPKSQDQKLRPYSLRTAGTGRRSDMYVNEMYVSEPKTRVVPDNPYPGPEVDTSSSDAGYTAEDMGVW